jgi:hypothetical protein
VSTFWIIFLGLGAAVVATFIYALTRPKSGLARRGTKSGQGDIIAEGGGSATFEGGQQHITHVTRDPQKYAEAFAPKTPRTKK